MSTTVVFVWRKEADTDGMMDGFAKREVSPGWYGAEFGETPMSITKNEDGGWESLKNTLTGRFEREHPDDYYIAVFDKQEYAKFPLV